MKNFQNFISEMAFTEKGKKYILDQIKDIESEIPPGYILGFHGSASDFDSFDVTRAFENDEWGFHFAAEFIGTQWFTLNKNDQSFNYLYVCALPTSKYEMIEAVDHAGNWNIDYVKRAFLNYAKRYSKTQLEIDLEEIPEIEFEQDDYTQYDNGKHLSFVLEKHDLNCIKYKNNGEPPFGQTVYMLCNVGDTINRIQILRKIPIRYDDNDYKGY